MNPYLQKCSRALADEQRRAARIAEVVSAIPDEVPIHFATGFHGRPTEGQPEMTIYLEEKSDVARLVELLEPEPLERGAPGFPNLNGTRSRRPIGPFFVNLVYLESGRTSADFCWMTEVEGVVVKLKRPVAGVYYAARHETSTGRQRAVIVRHHWERVTPFKGFEGDGKLIDQVHPHDMETLIWPDGEVSLEGILKAPGQAW